MRLLLAEDEKILSDALVEILQRNNYSVDAVYNGRDALDWLLGGEYDAAILDIMMPQLDGLSVVRQLRAAGSRLPVLLLTARSEIDDRVEGLDCGADDYLTKPFAMRELLARIRAITRRQPELHSTVLQLGTLRLDCADFQLSGPKGSLRLGNKEFQILQMLLMNPNQVISAERLLEKIWGYDSEAEVNSVWVYLSGLRKKIAQLGAQVQIRAVRGAGYILEEPK